MSTRAVDDYLSLPYHIEVVYDDSGESPGWFARVAELPGCMTQADTFAELGSMIQEAMRSWIEIGLEDGFSIPEPSTDESYSGKFVARLPRSLHRQLAEAADHDGVSLNAFMNVALAQAVGAAAPAKPVPAPVAPTAPTGPTPNWERLSASARAAMLAAGLQAEADQVDEKLFGNWLGNQLQQAQAAIESGYTREALASLEQCRLALTPCAKASPLMAVFQQLIDLMQTHLEQSHQWRESIVEQAMQARIAAQVQIRFSQKPIRVSRAPTMVDLSKLVDNAIEDAPTANLTDALFKKKSF